MQLVITGIHQRTAPVALRERLAFDTDTLARALLALREQFAEACIISTCNRVELYALIEDHMRPAVVTEFLANWHGISAALVGEHSSLLVGEDAARHLFRVASGLDSMVLGEDQIVGQIRSAMQAATDAQALGPNLRRLFDSALVAGKLVRTQTGLSRLNLSVVSVAIDCARQTFGTLQGQRFLIVGAGKMAELALKHLHATGAEITLLSRTAARAAVLAERYGASAAELATLDIQLASTDVVLSCTSSPEIIITAAQVARVTQQRERQLVLLDLAVPRDIDPLAALLPNVRLFDVDGMQAVCAANRAARAAEVAAAETLVSGEVAKFMAWWSSQRVVPTIRALRNRAEEIRSTELERTLARMPHLGQAEQAAISALSAAIVNKLLHSPITTLKNPQQADVLASAVQQLFQL